MLNVRRLTFVLEKRIREKARPMFYDPRPFDGQFFTECVESVLRDMGVSEFAVVVEETGMYFFHARVGVRHEPGKGLVWTDFYAERTPEFVREFTREPKSWKTTFWVMLFFILFLVVCFAW
jgi:hypothetical protein